MPRRRRTSLAVAALAAGLTLAGCGGTGADGLHGFTRPAPLQVGAVALPDASAPRAAPPVALRAPRGGMLLAFFGYTSCPDECPATLADLRQALRLLPAGTRPRANVAFITVDPVRDTRPVLRRYVGRFSAGWHALRPADASALRAAERPFHAASRRDPATAGGGYDVTHTLETYGIDDRGTVVVEWPYGTTSAAIASDVHKLLRG